MKITLAGSKQNLKNFITSYKKAYAVIENITLADIVYLLFTSHTLGIAAKEHNLEVEINGTTTSRKHLSAGKPAKVETDNSRITIDYK